MMKSLKIFFSRPLNLSLAAVTALYLLATSYFIVAAGNIINPDGIEYVAIARHYAAGNFMNAVNGIWSPLLSWILAIPVLTHISPLLFFRFVVLVLSIAIIVLFSYLLRRFVLSPKPSLLYHSLGVGIVAAFCFYATILTPLTPDLFSVFFAIWFLVTLLNYDAKPSRLNALLIGVSGGLGYYGKNYFAYFAVASFVLYYLFKLIQQRKGAWRQTAIHLGITMLVTLALVGPWVALMSIKYGKFTTDPVGKYALAQERPGGAKAFVTQDGLLPPLYSNSITAREDMSQYPLPAGWNWSPLDSRADLRYYVKVIIRDNIKIGLKLLLIPLLLVYSALLIAVGSPKIRKSILDDHVLVFSLVLSLIYVGGYCLEHLAGGFRYIWPSYILLAVCLIRIAHTLKIRYLPYFVAAGMLLLAINPITTYEHWALHEMSVGKGIRNTATQLIGSHAVPKDARIASNSPYDAANMCYYLYLKCYGEPLPNEVNAQLTKYNIGYVFNYKSKPPLAVAGKVVYRDSNFTVVKLR